MLSLRLSSFQLLTLTPLASQLPTLTRLRSESRNCPSPSTSPKLKIFRSKGAKYILLLLNFIREQSSGWYSHEGISASDEQEVRSPFLRRTLSQSVDGGTLAASQGEISCEAKPWPRLHEQDEKIITIQYIKRNEPSALRKKFAPKAQGETIQEDQVLHGQGSYSNFRDADTPT